MVAPLAVSVAAASGLCLQRSAINQQPPHSDERVAPKRFFSEQRGEKDTVFGPTGRGRCRSSGTLGEDAYGIATICASPYESFQPEAASLRKTGVSVSVLRLTVGQEAGESARAGLPQLLQRFLKR
jgi:hypothetical protein